MQTLPPSPEPRGGALDSPRPSSPGSLHDRRVVLLLLGFSLALYIATTGYDFVADDNVLLERNPYVQSFHYLGEIFTRNFWSFLGARGESNYYRPLVMLTLLVERVLFGPRPAAFHLVNVLLYALAVVLVYRLGRKLWPEGMGALWAGLLFAALPVHTENVAPVSGITDLECAVFFLLALLVYAEPVSSRGRMPRSAAWMAAGMFLLAALCKEVALVLPALVVLYEHFVRPNNSARWNERVGRYFPTLLLLVLFLAFRMGVVGGLPKLAAVRGLNWSRTVIGALSQLGDYVSKLAWPQHLTYSWKFHPPESWRDPSVLWGGLVGLGAAAALAGFWPRTTLQETIFAQGQADSQPVRGWRRDRAAAFAVVWFFLTLGPVVNFGGLGVVAYGERYLYLPSVAFCWLVGEGLARLAGPAEENYRPRRKFVWALGAILVALATARTAVRLPAWKNNFTLAKATLQEDPQAARFHLFLGNIYRERGERGRARIEYVQAIALDPAIPEAYLNMAGVLWDDGAVGAARDFLERAVEANPNLAEGFYELGRVELWQHHPQLARELFARAVALNANYFDALYTLGVMALEAGRLEEAEEFLTSALRANPSSVDAHLDLGTILARRNNPARAEAQFRRATELAPGSELPCLSLAGLYEAQGKALPALALYRRAVGLQPNSGNAQFRLGVLALKMGRVAEAVNALEHAVALQPNSGLARAQLGLAYQASGRLADARRELEKAVRLLPADETARTALRKLP